MKQPCTAAAALLLVLLSLNACSRGPAPQPVAEKPAPSPTAAAPAEPSLVQQADALMVAGKYTEGIDLLYKALGADMNNAEAWDLLAFGLNQLDQYDAAVVASQRALVLHPASAAVQFNAGVALAFTRNQDRIKAAAQPLEEAAAANPQAYTFSLLGRVHAAFGDKNGAIDAFQRGLAKFPGNADLKRGLAAATNDTNMDGTPDQVTLDKETVTIKDGSQGKELLRWTKAPMSGGGLFVSVVDLGGTGPAVLINTPPMGAYIWAGTPLAQVGSAPGPVEYNPVAREVTGIIMDKVAAKSHTQHIAFKDGQLTVLRTDIVPFKGDTSLPTNLLELNAALAAPNNAPAFVNYAGQPLWDKLTTLPNTSETRRGIIILPEPDGKYRLEVHINGVLKAKAAVTLSTGAKALQIASLTWVY